MRLVRCPHGIDFKEFKRYVDSIVVNHIIRNIITGIVRVSTQYYVLYMDTWQTNGEEMEICEMHVW